MRAPREGPSAGKVRFGFRSRHFSRFRAGLQGASRFLRHRPGSALPILYWPTRLAAHVFASTKLFADDTPLPVLDPGRGRTKTGRLWVYARDNRPWAGPDPPAAVYFYSPDRKAVRPAAHLEDFQGVLQVDGYAGFETLAACSGSSHQQAPPTQPARVERSIRAPCRAKIWACR